jgi:hypothetical protein
MTKRREIRMVDAPQRTKRDPLRRTLPHGIEA